MDRVRSPWRLALVAAAVMTMVWAGMAPAVMAAAPPSSPSPDPSAPSAPGQQATPPAPNPSGPQPVVPPAPADTTGPASLEYRVSPGDILTISVLGEAEVSGPFLVAPDGTISMQLIGQVQAEGLTLPELTDKVTQALTKFIRKPQVAIAIQSTSGNQKFVYLLGQVNRPGAYPMQAGWTIAALMATAGGFTGAAELPRSFILRKDQTLPVNLEKLLIDGDTDANVELLPGDVVIVPETKARVLVAGYVQKPGPYLIQPTDRVVDAIAAAGGPLPSAQMKDVGVIRKSAAGTKDVPVTHLDLTAYYKSGDTKQNILLQDGDVVYVPNPGFNWLNVLNAIGSVAWITYWIHP